jgi:hypothetical protein
MEVQNISGPDIMQSTFSVERPQLKVNPADNDTKISPNPPPVEDGKGARIDTYA